MPELDPAQPPEIPDPLLQAIEKISSTLGASTVVVVWEGGRSHESQSDLNEVTAAVARQVAGIYDNVQSKLRAGTKLDQYERTSIPHLAEHAINRAAASGDKVTIDNWIDLLGLLPRQNLQLQAGTAAPLYAKGVVAGNARAERELNYVLETEQHRTLASSAVQLRDAHLQCSSYGLTKAVAELSAAGDHRGLDLIDRYAVDDYDRLAQYVALLHTLRETNASPEQIARMEDTVAFTFRLLPSEVATRAFGARLMEGIHDENLRVSLIDAQIAALRNVVASKPHYITEEMVSDLLDGCVAAAPAVMGQKQRHIVEQVGAIANHVARPGFAEYKIAGALAQGATPQQVVDYARKLMLEDDRRLDNYEYEDFISEVDATLLKYATRYIDSGDYKGAKSFLDGMRSPFMAARAISYGLAHAESPEQARHLQVDELSQSMNPELATHWRLSNAMATAQPDEIVRSLHDLVHQPTAPYIDATGMSSIQQELRMSYGGEVVQQALQALPPEQRLRTVRELADSLSRAPAPSLLDDTLYDWRKTVEEQLTNTLARLGDPATVRAQYERVQRAEKPEAPHANWRGWLDMDRLLHPTDA
jgi:hypothetical protein